MIIAKNINVEAFERRNARNWVTTATPLTKEEPHQESGPEEFGVESIAGDEHEVNRAKSRRFKVGGGKWRTEAKIKSTVDSLHRLQAKDVASVGEYKVGAGAAARETVAPRRIHALQSKIKGFAANQ